jgi:hypothetical protein
MVKGIFEHQFVAAKDTNTQETIYDHAGFNIGRGRRSSGERKDKKMRKVREGPQDKGEPGKNREEQGTLVTPQQGKEGGNSASLIADAVVTWKTQTGKPPTVRKWKGTGGSRGQKYIT